MLDFAYFAWRIKVQRWYRLLSYDDLLYLYVYASGLLSLIACATFIIPEKKVDLCQIIFMLDKCINNY